MRCLAVVATLLLIASCSTPALAQTGTWTSHGPEGGSTSLLILKRRVKKLIEEEDPARPLTDEQITRILQSQGIHVTRRTVAKYREDMRIPSTHQRRVKK